MQKYIERKDDFMIHEIEPLDRVANIEVNPCRSERDETGKEISVEQCDESEAEFHSVYLRYEQNREGFGGLDCIADFNVKDEATIYANIVAKLLNVVVC